MGLISIPRSSLFAAICALLCLFSVDCLAQTIVQKELPAFGTYPAIVGTLGDGFVAKGTTTRIKVKLLGNAAGHVGSLYFLNPLTGERKRLFSNKDDSGVNVDLGVFPKGAPIIFEYVNESTKQPGKFTGSNIPGTYDFDAIPELRTAFVNKKPIPVCQDTNNVGDHRFAVSARVNSNEVEFGFEDLVSSGADYDYNDIVFIVSGVSLDSEIKLLAPEVPPGGSFSGTLTVTLPRPAVQEGVAVKLFYTTDGTDPTFDANGNPTLTTKVYTAPFPITETSTIKVISWGADVVDSTQGGTKVVASGVSSVTFTKLFSPPAQGVYLDKNGDGRIDAVSLTFNAKPTALPLKLVLEDPFSPGKKIEVTAVQLGQAVWADAVLTVLFPDQAFTAGTGFADKTLGQFPDGPAMFETAPFVIKDGVGPVVIAAQAIPPSSGTPAKLRVTFSEDVVVDTVGKPFPFQIKRPVGTDPNGKITVQSISALGNNVYEYVFASQATFFPVSGDSLKLNAGPALVDKKGLQSAMGHYIGVTGTPVNVTFEVKAKGGNYFVAETIVQPRVLTIPVSVVLPRKDKKDPAVCLDCATGEWKTVDPSRPTVFPSGPEIEIATQTSFRFDIAFFDNIGHFVNRAKGEVTDAMLKNVPDSAGLKKVSLMWYPVSADGHQAGNGAYLAIGNIFTTGLTGKTKGPQGEPLSIVNSSYPISTRFGYVR